MNALEALAVAVLTASGVGPPAVPAAPGHHAAFALEEAGPLVIVFAFVLPLLAALELVRRRH